MELYRSPKFGRPHEQPFCCSCLPRMQQYSGQILVYGCGLAPYLFHRGTDKHLGAPSIHRAADELSRKSNTAFRSWFMGSTIDDFRSPGGRKCLFVLLRFTEMRMSYRANRCTELRVSFQIFRSKQHGIHSPLSTLINLLTLPESPSITFR